MLAAHATQLAVLATAVIFLLGIKFGSSLGKEALAVLGVLLLAGVLVSAWLLRWAALIALPGTILGLLAVVSLLMWLFWPSRRLPRNRIRYQRWRLRCRLRPGRGQANVFELNVRWSRRAAFGESARTRPSLGGFWARATAAAVAYSVFLGRAQYRHGVRIPLQEHVALFAPPRTGKSGWLGTVIAHYPGPVISTTTKADLYGHTGAIRGRRGPVHVFNPEGIGGVPSTFAWNPLDGCQDPAVAVRRADAFAYAVSQSGVVDGKFWASKASDCLRALFHAAALAGRHGGPQYTMREVYLWAGGLTDVREAEAILLHYQRGEWAANLAQLRGEAQKTAETIRMTMTRALQFMGIPALARCVVPQPGRGIDFTQFLGSCGTLYLIAEGEGPGEDAPLAALFACLAGELRWHAAQMGSLMPGARLDPPLLMALDEVTQICPVPVDKWLADSGGKGIQIITVAHGLAQMRKRWGQHGARIILDTSGAVMLLPGVSDTETLTAFSELCGDVALHDRTAGGGDYNRTRVPIMDAAMIRQLPARCALVLRAGLSPLIVRLPMVWDDPACKRARRAAATAVAEQAAGQAAVHGRRQVPAVTPARVPELAGAAAPAAAPPAPAAAAGDSAQPSYPWRPGTIE
jgi:type IV secretion system protein VirD4